MDCTKEELKATIHKSFAVHKVIADAFRDACHRAGVSQASVMKQAMIDYIALHPEEDAETTFSTPLLSQENESYFLLALIVRLFSYPPIDS